MSEDDLYGQEHVQAYIDTDGERGYEWRGTQCLLLTTTGRKTGQPRILPLIFAPDGDRFVIVASKGGAPEHPAWYHNVKAHPQVTAQDGDTVVELTAREVSGTERKHWWELAVQAYPPYAEYQVKTERLIPVFVLE